MAPGRRLLRAVGGTLGLVTPASDNQSNMTTTVTANADRRLGHAAVEAAIRALGNVKLSPRGDSMLRVLLAFSAIRKDKSPTTDTTQGDVERVVADFFRVVD